MVATLFKTAINDEFAFRSAIVAFAFFRADRSAAERNLVCAKDLAIGIGCQNSPCFLYDE